MDAAPLQLVRAVIVISNALQRWKDKRDIEEYREEIRVMAERQHADACRRAHDRLHSAAVKLQRFFRRFLFARYQHWKTAGPINLLTVFGSGAVAPTEGRAAAPESAPPPPLLPDLCAGCGGRDGLLPLCSSCAAGMAAEHRKKMRERRCICDLCFTPCHSPQELESHRVSVCPLRLVACPGCEWFATNKLRAQDLKEHQERVCVARPVPCPLGCSNSLPLNVVHTHVKSQCSQRLGPCKLCSKVIRRCEVKKHLESCPARAAQCQWACGEPLTAQTKSFHEEYVCPARQRPCLKCGAAIAQADMSAHLAFTCKSEVKSAFEAPRLKLADIFKSSLLPSAAEAMNPDHLQYFSDEERALYDDLQSKLGFLIQQIEDDREGLSGSEGLSALKREERAAEGELMCEVVRAQLHILAARAAARIPKAPESVVSVDSRPSSPQSSRRSIDSAPSAMAFVRTALAAKPLDFKMHAESDPAPVHIFSDSALVGGRREEGEAVVGPGLKSVPVRLGAKTFFGTPDKAKTMFGDDWSESSGSPAPRHSSVRGKGRMSISKGSPDVPAETGFKPRSRPVSPVGGTPSRSRPPSPVADVSGEGSRGEAAWSRVRISDLVTEEMSGGAPLTARRRLLDELDDSIAVSASRGGIITSPLVVPRGLGEEGHLTLIHSATQAAVSYGTPPKQSMLPTALTVDKGDFSEWREQAKNLRTGGGGVANPTAAALKTHGNLALERYAAAPDIRAGGSLLMGGVGDAAEGGTPMKLV